MSEDWSDMNDENTTGTTDEPEGEQQPAQPEKPEPSYYLKRSAMLPVEGVVYCLTHTSVHDDTTDPYDYGYADCNAKDHRPIYYRARKGDVDERGEADPGAVPSQKRVIAASSSSGLTKAESGLVVRMTRTLNHTLVETRETLDQILGKDTDEGRTTDPLLALTDSILIKLDEDGDSDGD
jgi:hypothetical protein